MELNASQKRLLKRLVFVFPMARQGRFAEAGNHYFKAIRIRPDFAKAHNNLGIALIRLGRSEEAIFHFKAALRIKPDSESAKRNLRTVLSSRRKDDD